MKKIPTILLISSIGTIVLTSLLMDKKTKSQAMDSLIQKENQMMQWMKKKLCQ